MGLSFIIGCLKNNIPINLALMSSGKKIQYPSSHEKQKRKIIQNLSRI
jgi:hypothetical protein